jgi:hydroxymethylbilane synthase
MPTLRLGTRGSPLALYQANAVARALQARAGVSCEIVVIRTTGDQLGEAAAPAGAAGGKRVFVKEIEDALLARTIDLAVHSSKDMPVLLPEGLRIGAVLPREDPRDALVLPERRGTGHGLDEVRRLLGAAPVIGTSSVRRLAQLARVIPGARFVPARGNVGTRLRKLDAGEYDALVLAAAGLARLGLGARVSSLLPVDVSVPAPGQGIIAVEIRQGDRREELNAIDDGDASLALRAERALVERLGGGCQMPIGAYASIADGRLSITAIVISPDGSRIVRAEASGPAVAPEDVGERAGDELLAQGGDKILADVRQALPPAERHHT